MIKLFSVKVHIEAEHLPVRAQVVALSLCANILKLLSCVRCYGCACSQLLVRRYAALLHLLSRDASSTWLFLLQKLPHHRSLQDQR